MNLRLSLRRVFGLLMQIGDHEAAALLHGSLNASGAESALPFEPHDAGDVTATVDRLRSELGEHMFTAMVQRGTELSDAELVQLVRARIAAQRGSESPA